MRVFELIKKLSKLDPDMEIAILDGFNGGGEPRTINLGPSIRDVNRKYMVLDTDDIETKSGEIVVMGYGCY